MPCWAELGIDAVTDSMPALHIFAAGRRTGCAAGIGHRRAAQAADGPEETEIDALRKADAAIDQCMPECRVLGPGPNGADVAADIARQLSPKGIRVAFVIVGSEHGADPHHEYSDRNCGRVTSLSSIGGT